VPHLKLERLCEVDGKPRATECPEETAKSCRGANGERVKSGEYGRIVVIPVNLVIRRFLGDFVVGAGIAGQLMSRKRRWCSRSSTS